MKTVTIHIDSESCTRCGKCVKVCPSQIMVQACDAGLSSSRPGKDCLQFLPSLVASVQHKAGEPIELEHIQTCIACGHCAAVCPTGAVRHSEFPPEKVHHIDRKALPTPEQVLLLCRARRSNRVLLQKPVPQELLDQILEAAHYAPTASNRQEVGFTVITDPATLEKIIEFTFRKFGGMIKMLENPLVKLVLKPLKPDYYLYAPTFRRMEAKQKQGIDGILRGAKTLILIHTPKGNRFGFADANLAYQNASLMAESLNVSQIYTGFVLSALQMDKGGKFLRSLGIEGTVHAGMALGMPAFLYPNYIDRKPIDVKKI